MATFCSKLDRVSSTNFVENLNRAGVTSMQNTGRTYYVDGNRTSSGDGSTWESAFTKLSTALAASHANICTAGLRNWAGRNTIYFKGDDINDAGTSGNQLEDLVLLADKTDVIGVGARNAYSMPCIVGNHVPTNGMSTRFYNVQFRGAIASGGIIWTLASTSSGIQFHGCHFNGWSTAPATIGLKSTASPGLIVSGCKFLGAFSTAAIHLLAGNGNGTIIENNIIGSAGIGIDIDSGFSCANEQAWIIDNRIKATGLVIDADSEDICVMGNLGVSGGTFGANSHDMPSANSVGNIITGSNITGTVPFATIA
jgi:hypothetical protein